MACSERLKVIRRIPEFNQRCGYLHYDTLPRPFQGISQCHEDTWLSVLIEPSETSPVGSEFSAGHNRDEQVCLRGSTPSVHDRHEGLWLNLCTLPLMSSGWDCALSKSDGSAHQPQVHIYRGPMLWSSTNPTRTRTILKRRTDGTATQRSGTG